MLLNEIRHGFTVQRSHCYIVGAWHRLLTASFANNYKEDQYPNSNEFFSENVHDRCLLFDIQIERAEGRCRFVRWLVADWLACMLQIGC